MTVINIILLIIYKFMYRNSIYIHMICMSGKVILKKKEYICITKLKINISTLQKNIYDKFDVHVDCCGYVETYMYIHLWLPPAQPSLPPPPTCN